MTGIPKVVHLSWKDKRVLEHPSPLIRNGIRNLAELNPDWAITVYDDEELDAELRRYLSPADYALLVNCHIVEKCDAWRLAKLFYEGGLYMDIDRFYNVPLTELIDEETAWVLPTYRDHDFSQDFMLSKPGNPVFREALELVLERRRAGHTSTYFLGAQTYLHAVSRVLVGHTIDTDPGAAAFAELRERIDSLPFIRTYRETSPYDTIVYRHDPEVFKTDASGTTDWETLKREFYASYSVRHWTGEW